MDPLQAFLSGKSVQRRIISGGSTGGRVRTEYETPDYTEEKVPEKTTRYAEPYVRVIRDTVWKVNACSALFCCFQTNNVHSIATFFFK